MPWPMCITRPAVRLEKPASARRMKKGVWFEEGEQVARLYFSSGSVPCGIG